MAKEAFDIDGAMNRLREAVKPFPKAAMFALADEGYTSLFEQLIACILSIRTKDETSLPVARRLFQTARTPQQIRQLSVEKIEQLIRQSTFADAKAKQIWEISDRTLHEFNGELPCDFEVLTSFNGVGPKCANLALGIACNYPCISVDIHVHRVTNRWGYATTRTPEKTLTALEAKLPKPYWIEINSLLVPFGKHICTGELPRCSTCSLLEMCAQVGVTKHR
ncbi:endonuclease III [Kovacikia minuta CCNUW1]|uniref:endonuclease III domain-containing protein n=1 Tax=Kovacikia minuta TaxID=2931930 RepID=UPI001CCAFABB|nr:endonuclease III [Kovacikia minuta]UBF26641.1 endonuclease III [Kovacikia minuta CCNUW1]